MHAEQLRSLLSDDGIVPGNVLRATSLCEEWFRMEPSLPVFVLRAIFRELSQGGWDDPQGIPTAEYLPFRQELLPRLKAVVDFMLAEPQGQPTAALADLVRTFRDCCRESVKAAKSAEKPT
jgi:hypothetical protein